MDTGDLNTIDTQQRPPAEDSLNSNINSGEPLLNRQNSGNNEGDPHLFEETLFDSTDVVEFAPGIFSSSRFISILV